MKYELRNQGTLVFMEDVAAKPTSKFCRTQAFTLIELLVVIGVVVILMALLFPVAKSLIKRSQNTTCISNLKSMGGALGAYIAEHDGAFIPGSESNINPDGGPSLLWYQVLEPYMGRSTPLNNSKAVYDPIRPRWQVCPAKKGDGVDYREIGYGWNHEFFGVSGSLAATGSNLGAYSRISQVSNPARTIIIGDSHDKGGSPYWYHFRLYGRSNNMSMCAERHAGRGNYLMADGHVESLTPGELTDNNNYLYRKIKP